MILFFNIGPIVNRYYASMAWMRAGFDSRWVHNEFKNICILNDKKLSPVFYRSGNFSMRNIDAKNSSKLARFADDRLWNNTWNCCGFPIFANAFIRTVQRSLNRQISKKKNYLFDTGNLRIIGINFGNSCFNRINKSLDDLHFGFVPWFNKYD